MSRIQQVGLEPDVVSYTTLIDACAKKGLVEEAEHWLAQMLERGEIKADVVAYTAVISAHANQGKVDGALKWLSEMRKNGVEANLVTFPVCGLVRALVPCPSPP